MDQAINAGFQSIFGPLLAIAETRRSGGSIQDEINAEEAKHKRIKELENKVEKLEEKIRPTNEMIWKLKDEIIKIKKDLGISDYSLNLR